MDIWRTCFTFSSNTPVTRLEEDDEIMIIIHIGLIDYNLSAEAKNVSMVDTVISKVKKAIRIPQSDSWEMSQEILIFLIPLLNLLLNSLRFRNVNRQIQDMQGSSRPNDSTTDTQQTEKKKKMKDKYEMLPTAPSQQATNPSFV